MVLYFTLIGCSEGDFAPNSLISVNTEEPPFYGLVVRNLTPFPSMSNDPQILVEGPNQGDTTHIWTDASCTISYASGTFSTPSTVYRGTTHPGAVLPADGYYTFYVSFDFADGSDSSTCYKTRARHLYDSTPPDPSLYAWNLSSPTNGQLINDSTPNLGANGLSGEEGTALTVYEGTACGATVSSSSVNSSENVSSTWSYLRGGADDGAHNFSIRLVDLAGNDSGCFNPTQGYTLDTVAPDIIGSTQPADAFYVEGDNVIFTITYNDNVDVIGTPRIPIVIGNTTRYATLTGGSGTTTLTFSYTVVLTDNDSNGIVVASNIDLNGSASIRDSAGNNADLNIGPLATTGILIDGGPPNITSVTTSASGTFIPGNTVTFVVSFDEQVTISGTSRLQLNLASGGPAFATFAGPATASSFNFVYTVGAGEDDLDGVTLSSPLQIVSGTIQDAASNNANLTYTLPNTSAVRVDSTPPTITSLTNPGAVTVISSGNNVNVTVNYDEAVTVNTGGGTPSLDFILDAGGPETATYVSGSGSSSIVFRFVVDGDDLDTNGIVSAVSIALNGSTIRDGAGNNADLTVDAPASVSDASNIHIDGVIPLITSITNPALVTHGVGDTLQITVNYDDNVSVTGNPTLGFTMSDSSQVANATYASGSGTSSLVFEYTVLAGNEDTDGIVTASAIVLSGGTIRDSNSNNADLTIDAPANPASASNIRIDAIVPLITSVENPGVITTHSFGDIVTITVNYSEAVTVNTGGGTPTLGINLGGGGPETATYSGGSGTSAISFQFIVDGDDLDTNGIVTASSIVLNGATMFDGGGGAADLVIDAPASPSSASNIRIDGVAPSITSITNPGSLTNHSNGDVVTITVNYDEAVTVATGGGTPSLSINLGAGGPETATYSSGSGTTAISFQFTVDADDLDTDGIVTAANIVLNGGTMRDANGNNADLGIDAPASPSSATNIRIDGISPTITSLSNPGVVTIISNGNNADITVNYDETVIVATGGGSPSLNILLESGGPEIATYVSGSGTSSLVFRFVVDTDDLDTNGITTSGSIVLNGGTIRDTSGNNADLTIDAPASITDPTNLRIDGVAPLITSITNPALVTHGVGDTLQITVNYDDNVTVVTGGGTPTLGFTMSDSSQTVNATYASGSGTSSLVFEYTVLAGNEDSNGIVTASAIVLNGGTIRDGNSNNADLVIDAPASTTSPSNIRVDAIVPLITSLTNPGSATMHNLGDTVTITVNYSESVTVNVAGGTPTLAINLGAGGPETATYSGGSGTSAISFQFTVDADDLDTNGIVTASSIVLNGATILDGGGGAADLVIDAPASPSSPSNILIDGVAPTITSVTNPGSLTNYNNGDVVTIAINYDEAVTVATGGGTPSLSINLGAGGPETATYSGGSGTTAISFQFTVDADDLDTDGIVTAANIFLNGGTMRDANGNNADLGIDAPASPSSATNIRIDGISPTITSLSNPGVVTIISNGNNADITVNYDETVTVATGGGTPSLSVNLGAGGPETATYVSGSGTSNLVFRFVVDGDDLDVDGVVTAAVIDLNGGTIRDPSGNDADLTIDAPASTSDPTNLRIDGIAPLITSITNPVLTTYGVGDTLQIRINYDDNVVVNTGGGTPTLGFTMSDSGQTVNASYASGSGTSALVFEYTVVAGNEDTNGIVTSSSIVLNGGTMRDSGGNNADLLIDTPANPSSPTNIRVDAILPVISSIFNPGTATTYINGETVTITVVYGEAVTVNTGGGTPTLGINLGAGGPETATYSGGSGTTSISFQFTVDADDLDKDGIVTASSIVLNGGTMVDGGGGAADLTIDGSASPSDPSNVRIDGIVPSITSVTNPGNITNFSNGDSVTITVNYDEAVTVVTGGGTPSLSINLEAGGAETATYSGGSGTSAISFQFTVDADDLDTDGIVTAASIDLNGGTMRDASGNNVDLTIDAPASPSSPTNIRIDGIVPSIISVTNPGSITTFSNGDSVTVTVNYDEAVTVATGDGTPSLSINLGAGGPETATYSGGSGTTAISFQFTVDADDLDTNGIVTASSIFLNGGTMRDPSGNNADLTIDAPASPSSPTNIRIDGIVPSITSVANPGSITTFSNGDSVTVTVNYDEAVTVATGGGTPSLSINLGSGGPETATYSGGSGTTAISFQFTVDADDLDTNGIVTASSIFLNGGTMRDPSGNNADLTIDAPASPSSPTNIRIDGIVPSITSVANPGSITTFSNGDSVTVTVNYDEAVTVATGGGTPSLSINLGSGGPETATYSGGSGTTAISFQFTVDADDLDTNGIVTASSIFLNGGTMRDPSGNNADLTIDAPASPSSPTNIRIDGVAPTITNFDILTANGSYTINDEIDFRVTYDEAVIVASGTPTINLTLNSGAEVVSYRTGSGTTQISFRYTVQAGDTDTNGIVIATIIALSGATMRDAAGNNADLTHTAPNTSGVLIDTTNPGVATALTLNSGYVSDAKAFDSPTFGWTNPATDFASAQVSLRESVTGDTVAWAAADNSGVAAGLGNHIFDSLNNGSIASCDTLIPEVRILDAAGNNSAVASHGTGFIWDNVAPNAATGMTEISNAASTQTILADWDNMTDGCSGTNVTYEVALGRDTDTDTTIDAGEIGNIIAWKDIGSTSQYQFTQAVDGMTLSKAVDYFISVRTKDAAGNVSTFTHTGYFRYEGVSIADPNFTNGTSTVVPPGANRILIFAVYFDDDIAADVTDVDYGGEDMEHVVTHEHVRSGGWRTRTEVWILREADIVNASTTNFTVTWAATPGQPGDFAFSSFTILDTDQTNPVDNVNANDSDGTADLTTTVNSLLGGLTVGVAAHGGPQTDIDITGTGTWVEGIPQVDSQGVMKPAYAANAAAGTVDVTMTPPSNQRNVIIGVHFTPAP